uniref:Group II intron maturase-specific domain-containing protein n=1 Tax=Derbesia sp. WEST4838 TaxID=1847751 RepID=A0A1C9JBD9_9CHLO|nr:hypothetical protein [Derbesia sp. WEST4838]AOP19161.1 hypothetical protein [Derbesia sp. WEST4838]
MHQTKIVDYLYFFKWILKIENSRKIYKLKFQIFMTKQEGNPYKLQRLQKLIFYHFGLQLISRYIWINKNKKIHIAEYIDTIRRNKTRQFRFSKRQKLKVRDLLKDYQFQFILIYHLCLEWDLNFFSRFHHQQIRLIERMKTIQSTHNWFMIIHINQFKNYHKFILQKMSQFSLQFGIKKWVKWVVVSHKKKDFLHFHLFRIFMINLILFDLINFLKKNIQMDRHSNIFNENSKLLLVNFTSQKLFIVLRLIKKWEQNQSIQLRYKPQIAPLYFGFCFFNLHFQANKNYKNKIKFKIGLTNSSLVQIMSLFDFYWLKARGKSISYIIHKLNPLIQKICSFYSNFIDISFLKKLDHWLLLKSWRYLKCYHSNKSNHWIYRQYYCSRQILNDKGFPLQHFYIFYDNKTQLFLYRFITFSRSNDVI